MPYNISLKPSVWKRMKNIMIKKYIQRLGFELDSAWKKKKGNIIYKRGT